MNPNSETRSSDHESVSRRSFLTTSAAGASAIAVGAYAAPAPAASSSSPNEQIVMAVMGMGGRGTTLAGEFEGISGVTVKGVYDVDLDRAKQAANAVGKVNNRDVAAGQDFRPMIDDPEVDAVVIATCNHWHAPAAIMAAKAGKHVYCEKPCSHNPWEGEQLVAAARKYNRQIQHGTQRRSYSGIMKGIQRLHDGVIGPVYYAHTYYRNVRPSLGNAEPSQPPKGLDYELWRGPAPDYAYRSNLLHYNWHWRWHFGNGELGNNGVHMLDVARWGLDADYPIHVCSTGGRFRYPDDDQETPDTQIAAYKFEGNKQATWEALSCNRSRPGDRGESVWFYGYEGAAIIDGNGCTIVDANDKVIERHDGTGGQAEHLANFIAAIRGEAELNAEIEEGHRSALLCHLGNISYRTGRSLHCDPSNGHIRDDEDAMSYWKREYAPGYEPQV